MSRLTSPLPPPASSPAFTSDSTRALRERRIRLDDPDPRSDVQDPLEDADDVVAAAERGPETEQHDLDADEDAEQRAGGALDPAVGAREGRDEVLKRERERVELHGRSPRFTAACSGRRPGGPLSVYPWRASSLLPSESCWVGRRHCAAMSVRTRPVVASVWFEHQELGIGDADHLRDELQLLDLAACGLRLREHGLRLRRLVVESRQGRLLARGDLRRADDLLIPRLVLRPVLRDEGVGRRRARGKECVVFGVDARELVAHRAHAPGERVVGRARRVDERDERRKRSLAHLLEHRRHHPDLVGRLQHQVDEARGAGDRLRQDGDQHGDVAAKEIGLRGRRARRELGEGRARERAREDPATGERVHGPSCAMRRDVGGGASGDGHGCAW